MNVFSEALNNGVELKTKTNQYGTSVIKSIGIGEKGAIEVSFLYEIGSETPKVTTLIPKIYK
ncbi:hypothetical protein [Apibacter adventoris]|uniref:hypothetical protein n=1 Tax=Apibacter adventoris TaxID=1679466 RepID=UPI000CF61033|nr:hypothetical protein [Apibacter adventoris]PQL94359.1 hypothetical protein C4S76_05660 [Apibacter adventoris]